MTLKELVPARILAIWIALVLLSIMGPALGSDGNSRGLIVGVVLAFAVVKMRFVGLDFMELRHAPVAMRAAFEGYCLVLWAVLVALYLLL